MSSTECHFLWHIYLQFTAFVGKQLEHIMTADVFLQFTAFFGKQLEHVMIASIYHSNY